MLSLFKTSLQKIYHSLTSPIKALFARPIDQTTINELEALLLAADTGSKTTSSLINTIKQQWQHGSLQQGEELKAVVRQELLKILTAHSYKQKSDIYLLVGINGSGKTTTASKLALALKQQNKKVLFIAADTFRAAATAQLQEWASQLQVDCVVGKENQDPASVIFSGIQQFKNNQYGALIIDTAGRVQTKINLMKELEKIKRVITTQLPDQPITTLLTIDAMLGQNSFEQAKIFHESTPVDGIILTKMDGTGKGGIVFAIASQLHIPIAYISYGEKPDAFASFDASAYIDTLLN